MVNLYNSTAVLCNSISTEEISSVTFTLKDAARTDFKKILKFHGFSH